DPSLPPYETPTRAGNTAMPSEVRPPVPAFCPRDEGVTMAAGRRPCSFDGSTGIETTSPGMVWAGKKPKWSFGRPGRRFPNSSADANLLVVGQGHGGSFLQVIYVREREDMVFVIHARPLTDREKRRYRRRKRK